MDIETIKHILSLHGRLSCEVANLSEDSDLYHAGLTSLATVGLMLALEDEFDVEFPDAMLSRRTFGSIGSISDAIDELRN